MPISFVRRFRTAVIRDLDLCGIFLRLSRCGDRIMEKIANEVLSFINHMEPQHWLFVLAGVIVVGFVCMKGMGSRSHY